MNQWISRFVSLFLIIFSWSVNAHPHIFIDSYYKASVSQGKLEQLEAFWLVDDFTSSSVMMGYDLDLDGQILGQEKEDLIKAFDAFNEQAYFLKIEKNGQPILPANVTITDLQVRNQQLWLSLSILLPEVVNLRAASLSLAFGDDTMYTALLPDQQIGLVQLTGQDAENCTPEQRESEVITIDSWIDLSC
ncbi:DUF1007 family protein [Marinomonas agarivorans]|nr:DUF1007 family protein [Marinomonas agarivorans]